MKNKKMTYKGFKIDHTELFNEWASYYKEHALSEFDSLINYSEMIFWDNAPQDEVMAKRGLYKFLLNEIVRQLEKDKERNYYERELA